MKNKFLFAILCLAFNVNLVSQEFNKQYSVNTTTFLETKLEVPSSPYQITIKTLDEKSNKRFSAGVKLSTAYSIGFAANLDLRMRFGKERFIDFGKNEKWRFLYGLDFPVGLRMSTSSSWVLGAVNAGVSPFAGLQFRINERLILYTETNYEMFFTAFESSQRRGQFRLLSSFRSPGSIWLGFELFKAKKKEKF